MEENPQGLELFIARQNRKRHLAEPWARLAGLKPGMVVLDFGCGPGILTQEYARIAGPEGLVYGVEQSAAVAARLKQTMQRVVVFVQNYDSVINLAQTPDIIFLTDTLHHLATPLPVLRRILTACGVQTRLFIAEYDPEQPGLMGAKLHRRMPKAQLLSLIEAAGFVHDGIFDTEDEHYGVIARC